MISLDSAIRFVGVASMQGSILAAKYRTGLQPLLTTEESELSIMHSVIRMSMRKTQEKQLGKPIYAFALYQKVKRATIVAYDSASETEELVMVSLDKDSNHDSIISEKILPYLRSAGRKILD
jgi:hypothetical protein